MNRLADSNTGIYDDFPMRNKGIGGITELPIPSGGFSGVTKPKPPPPLAPQYAPPQMPSYVPPPPMPTSTAGYKAPPPVSGGYKPSQKLPSYITSDPMYQTPFNPGEAKPYQDVYDWGRGADTSGFFTSNWNDPKTGMGYGDVNSKLGKAGLNYSYNAPKPWTPPTGAVMAPTIPNQFISRNVP